MGFYKNPLIGWFLSKRLKFILVLFVITMCLYILFYRNFTHEISYGCKHPNCDSTRCTGNKCKASGCFGNNCKAGDCFGEECEAGACQGVGCRAGDCYGKDCVPGLCADPECSSKDAEENKCIPFCKNGNAYNLPFSKIYSYTSKLPRNSILNPDFCNNAKPTYIMKDKKHIWNFMVDFVNFDNVKSKTPEELANPDDLQDGKRFIMEDQEFINTTPNILKKYNCTWCSKMKGNEICASYKPYLNPVRSEYSWHPDNWTCETLDNDGNNDYCKTTNDSMNLVNVLSVKHKINLINNSARSLAEKNFDIESIIGEMLTFQCKNGKTCTQHINLKNNLTDYFGNIIPCTRRAYMIRKLNINNVLQYKPIAFRTFKKGSFEQQEYIYNNAQEKSTFRDNHLWTYNSSVNGKQFYECYWCKKVLVIENYLLPRKSNGDLESCFYSNDFNHYMYQHVDENKNVYLKCLKCKKEVYY